MISDRMKPLLKNNSTVRMMFEEGKRMAAIYGAENVYDFSIGNPSVPAPAGVAVAIREILDTEDSGMVHGYMNNAGYEDVRAAVAESLNKRFDTNFSRNNILMTVGAAGAMNVALKTLLNPGDEVIVFAPYFLEYGHYINNYDGVITVISPDISTFQPNLTELRDKINQKTKAVIINSPHNPTGVIYSEDTIKEIAAILRAKETEFGSSIVIIADEPYRELVYMDTIVPYIPKYYHNTIVCYSYSKSLSLPGERIGYLVLPDELDDAEAVFTVAAIANRILGAVNAPSLIQRAIMRCLDEKVDVEAYRRNRDLLYKSLMEYGFSCVEPEGAFYLFMKSPEADDKAFCQAAVKYHILMVPGTSFACPGYVRLAYCVSYEAIERSLPAFKALAAEYGLEVTK